MKVGVPSNLDREARTLQLANGAGYANLFAFDESRGAMLLERLDEKLADGDHSIRQQIEIVCETLKSAWRRLDDPGGLMTGGDKAHWHRDFIQAQWAGLVRSAQLP